jgi:hypothetical protein
VGGCLGDRRGRREEGNGGDHRIGRAFLEFGVGAQLIDGARRRKLLAVEFGPILGGESEYLGSLLDCLVNGVARCEHARHIGKGHAVTAVSVLVDEGDVMRHSDQSFDQPASL